ncbi:hypothetical protein ACFC26_17170 [Kitasatospora purpeofusca]|uniref:hypothetical protein n=1 Tax=Kitasatospora purpeofusca TaxID=67352 RepID=UPI0035D5ACEF
MADREYKLTPGYIDVDLWGWEITSSTDDAVDHTCHEPFSDDPDVDDARAKAWADEVIGTRQQWWRVEENPNYHWYHFVSL